jgi:hypothetical protein
MLPDCLCARLPGSLEEAERVVADFEAGGGVEATADKLRPDVELPGRLRWVRRRLGAVYAGLLAVRTLLAGEFSACEVSLSGFRDLLGVTLVLPALRAKGAAHLHALPPPIGFGPRRWVRLQLVRRQQHSVGPRAPPERP